MLPAYNLRVLIPTEEGMDDVVACVHVDVSTMCGLQTVHICMYRCDHTNLPCRSIGNALSSASAYGIDQYSREYYFEKLILSKRTLVNKHAAIFNLGGKG